MAVSLIQRVTSSRWRTAAAVVAVGFWTTAYVVYFSSVRTPLLADGHVVGGDFVCFYGAARVVSEGDGRRLYDPERQLQAQRAALAAGDDYRLGGYVNPPTWAVVLAPLARLPYLAAFHLHTALMLGAFALAMRLLRPHLAHLARNWTTVVLLALGFFPMIRAIAGGQNTALTFLLLAGAYGAWVGGREGAAGVWLGLLLYKPQYALPLIGLMLLRGQWRVVATASLVGLGHYVVGAAACGWAWPLDVLTEIRRFAPVDFGYNAGVAISLPAVSAACLPGIAGRILGAAAVALTATAMVRAWWGMERSGAQHDRGPGRMASELEFATADGEDEWGGGRSQDERGLAPRFGLAVCGALLISPHSYFYDAGLLVLPVLLGLEQVAAVGQAPSAAIRGLLAVGFLAFPIFRLHSVLGFQPVVFWPLMVMLWCERLCRSGGRRAVRTSRHRPGFQGWSNPVGSPL